MVLGEHFFPLVQTTAIAIPWTSNPTLEDWKKGSASLSRGPLFRQTNRKAVNPTTISRAAFHDGRFAVMALPIDRYETW